MNGNQYRVLNNVLGKLSKKTIPSTAGEEEFELMEALGQGPSMLSNYAPVITIRGEITERTAQNFRAAVDKLKYQRQSEVALLEINSVGGEVYAAFEMLNTIRSSGMDWITYNASHAFSAGALLLSAGTSQARFMSPKSTAMIHGLSGGIGYSGIDEIAAQVEHDVKLNEMLLDEIAKNCKTTTAKLKKLIKDSGARDLWLMPEDALKLKLVDHVDIISLNPVQGFELQALNKPLKAKGKE